jgi:glutathione S-transferase
VLIATSRRACRSSVRRARLASSALRVTSQGTASAPSAAAACARRPASRAASTTRAPSFTKRSAIARPNPPLPPTTTATRPESLSLSGMGAIVDGRIGRRGSLLLPPKRRRIAVKFYNSLGPNPRLVRMFMAEKGLTLDKQEIDIMAGENRRAPYTDKNPGGQMPALELDNGSVLAETVAICEYLEEKNPKPALIGSTPEERAETRMWTRRIELRITGPLTDGFRFGEGIQMFKDRMRTVPEAADGLKAIARDGEVWLDGLLRGKKFVCGDRFTLADIVLYNFLDFGKGVGQAPDAGLKNLAGWFDRVASRPSAEASLHPIAKAGNMRA